MTDTSLHRKTTDYGFEFGAADVMRCWSHKGTVCVRVASRTTGKYIDIQVSPAGRTMHVIEGKYRLYKDEGP